MRYKVKVGGGMILGVVSVEVGHITVPPSNPYETAHRVGRLFIEIDLSAADIRMSKGVTEIELPYLPADQVTDMDYSNSVPILTVRSEEAPESAAK